MKEKRLLLISPDLHSIQERFRKWYFYHLKWNRSDENFRKQKKLINNMKLLNVLQLLKMRMAK